MDSTLKDGDDGACGPEMWQRATGLLGDPFLKRQRLSHGGTLSQKKVDKVRVWRVESDEEVVCVK